MKPVTHPSVFCCWLWAFHWLLGRKLSPFKPNFLMKYYQIKFLKAILRKIIGPSWDATGFSNVKKLSSWKLEYRKGNFLCCLIYFHLMFLKHKSAFPAKYFVRYFVRVTASARFLVKAVKKITNEILQTNSWAEFNLVYLLKVSRQYLKEA